MTISGSTARSARSGAAAWALLCIACAGCELFSDLDRFEQEDEDEGEPDAGGAGQGGNQDAGASDLGCSNPRTLCVRIEGFSPHVDELVNVDLVTNADNILRARAIVDPAGGLNADFVLPLAIPMSEVPEEGEDHPLHVEMFADQNKDGEYTSGGLDHEWNIDLPDSGKLVFPHNSEFTTTEPRPRTIGADFRMEFFEMVAHVGQLLEVMVIEVDGDGQLGRTVGLYRFTSLPSADFEVVIPGIIDPGGLTYLVEFYADHNDDGNYDDPPVDHTWNKFVESSESGVATEFTHGTDFEALQYQFDFEER